MSLFSSSNHTQVLTGGLFSSLTSRGSFVFTRALHQTPPCIHTHINPWEQLARFHNSRHQPVCPLPFISSLLSLHLLLIFHPLCLRESIETLSVFLTSIEVLQLRLSFPSLFSYRLLETETVMRAPLQKRKKLNCWAVALMHFLESAEDIKEHV